MKISPSALAVLSNTDVIAIDQDPAGVQGHIAQFDDDYDVLAKPPANGDIAVVLQQGNRTEEDCDDCCGCRFQEQLVSAV
jgi:alpha-galactosidase